MPVLPAPIDQYGQLQVIQVTTTKALKSYERFLHIANGAYTITLPPVAQCAGMFVGGSQTDSGTSTVSIAHAGDSAGWTNLVVNAINEGFLVWSDGRRWIVLSGATS